MAPLRENIHNSFWKLFFGVQKAMTFQSKVGLNFWNHFWPKKITGGPPRAPENLTNCYFQVSLLFIQILINFWTYTVFQTLGSHSVSDLYPCQCKNERKYFSSFLTKIFFHIYDSNIFPRKQILKLFPNATFREVIFQSICQKRSPY